MSRPDQFVVPGRAYGERVNRHDLVENICSIFDTHAGDRERCYAEVFNLCKASSLAN